MRGRRIDREQQGRRIRAAVRKWPDLMRQLASEPDAEKPPRR